MIVLFLIEKNNRIEESKNRRSWSFWLKKEKSYFDFYVYLETWKDNEELKKNVVCTNRMYEQSAREGAIKHRAQLVGGINASISFSGDLKSD